MRTFVCSALIGIFAALPASVQAGSCRVVSQSYSYAAPAAVAYAPSYIQVIPTVLVPAAIYTVGSVGLSYLPPPATVVAPAAVQPSQAPAGADKLDLILSAVQRQEQRFDALEQRIAALEIKNAYGMGQPKAPAPREAPKSKEHPGAAEAGKCAACHLPSRAEQHGGGFLMFDDKNQTLPYSAEQAELIRKKVLEGKMPPKNSGHSLTQQQRVDLLDFLRIPLK